MEKKDESEKTNIGGKVFHPISWLCYTETMSALFSDTNPKAEQLQIDLIRRMPMWKKCALLDDLNETVKAFAVSGLKKRHPEAAPEIIRRMLADLMLGPELASKVYDHAR